jgi:NTP pyrophosphatase (non-canonical NTP hydrolase)
MYLDDFVKNAIRTESRIDEVVVNELLLTATIQNLISMGNILDQIKKHAFYGKPYDISAIRNHFSMAAEAMTTLSTITADEIANDERPIPVNPRLFHAVVGISTEATELLEALDLYGRDMDNTNLLEEFGDIDWYKAIGVDELGGDWEDILIKIIEKLRLRYPDKFTNEDAVNRDLEGEREILETIQKAD